MDYRDGITCIIVSYKSLDCLKMCLESLRKQEKVPFEIVVIDNNSGDGTGRYLSELDIKYILLDKNRGFGAAVNLGAKEAEYKYLFILNPDTMLPRDSLRKLYEFAETESDGGLIAPALEYPDGKPQLSARSIPRRRDFLLGRGSPLFRLGITGERNAGYFMPEDDKPIEIPAVSATALMIKTALFNEIGGFDERFFMYLEDIDLCRRIRDKGMRIILVPEVRIKHSWKTSSSKRPFFTVYHHHLSVLKYFNKYDKKQLPLNLILATVLVMGFLLGVITILCKKVMSR